jgi:hypothetical protein
MPVKCLWESGIAREDGIPFVGYEAVAADRLILVKRELVN